MKCYHLFQLIKNTSLLITLLVIETVCLNTFIYAQSQIQYEISFDNADHHEAEVQVIFPNLSNKTLEIRMSRTSPGRYALHEFAKNVYNVRAYDSKGNKLMLTRPNPHQWNVAGHDGLIKLNYTIFGDRCDGTYLAIDNTHAHLNIPATFMWARGLEKRPIIIRFKKPDPEWKIATQLIPTQNTDTFTAPNLDYFMDSPTEISNFDFREWEVNSTGKKQTIRLAIHHEGNEEEVDVYANLVDAVVKEEIAIYGEPAVFDHGTYTFIADYLPYVQGDGMEHRNSTILTSSYSIKEDVVDNLWGVIHEFFHSWNGERIRPRSLEPFNFEETNNTGELWFAEGFTAYYDYLFLHRAKIVSIDNLASLLSIDLNLVFNAPGRRLFSPVEMSQKAPFYDGAVYKDPNNFKNTFISYYYYGLVIGLGLDLEIRTRFPNISLDDFMRIVWEKHGKTEIPYTNEDLRRLLGEVTGDSTFANNFFRNYIYGHNLPDYKNLLEQTGFLLRKKNEGETWIGQTNFEYDNSKTKILSSTLIGSPLYLAGLDRKDIIITIAGDSLKDNEKFEKILKAYKPNEKVEILFEKNGVEKVAELTFQEDPTMEVVPFEHAGIDITQEIQQIRENWLGSKSDFDKSKLVRYCPKCNRSFPFRYEFCRYDGKELNILPKENQAKLLKKHEEEH